MLAALSVIVLHAVADEVVAPRHDGTWRALVTVDSLVRWPVPVFVMVSGALLLDGGRAESSVEFFRRRARRVVIPLVAWTAFYSVWSAVWFHQGWQVRTTALAFAHGSAYIHVYFLWIVAGLYVVTPALRSYLATLDRTGTGLLALLLMAAGAVDQVSRVALGLSVTDHALTQWLPYAGYFVAGHWLVQLRTRPSRRALLVGYGMSSAAVAAGTIAALSHSSSDRSLYLLDYLDPLVVVQAVSVFCLALLTVRGTGVASSPVWERLAGTTLGVYLVHPLLLAVASRNGFDVRSAPALLSLPLLVLVVAGLSGLAVSAVMRVPLLRRLV